MLSHILFMPLQEFPAVGISNKKFSLTKAYLKRWLLLHAEMGIQNCQYYKFIEIKKFTILFPIIIEVA